MTHPPAWPITYRDSRDLTFILNRPIVQLRLVEYGSSVDLEITYGDNGEIVLVNGAGGCGCCGSPYIPEE